MVNSLVPQSLNLVNEARLAFSRDVEIDAAENAKLTNLMRHIDEQFYDAEKIALVLSNKLRFLRLKDDNILKTIESPDPMVKMASGFIAGEDDSIGGASTEVDASIEECASWDYYINSREKMKSFGSYGGLIRSVTKLNNHSQVSRTVYDLTGVPTILPREWLQKLYGNGMIHARN